MNANSQFGRPQSQHFNARTQPHEYSDDQTVQPWLKSAVDKVIATTALLFFAPVLLIIVLLMYFSQGGKIIHRSSRIGEGGKPFECLKLRTMVLDADVCLAKHLQENADACERWQTHRKLEDDPRITCMGQFLRKSSLDELPQLWNVLRGEMSIVGPRPIMEDEATHYGSDFKYYLGTRPGITGLWQVSGRSGTNYDTRVELDKFYAMNRGPSLDLKIIMKTVKVVLLQDGAC